VHACFAWHELQADCESILTDTMLPLIFSMIPGWIILPEAMQKYRFRQQR
jgi:hypothetical protein